MSVIAQPQLPRYDVRVASKPAKKTSFQRWLTDGLATPGKTGSELARLLGVAPARVAEMKSGIRQPQATELKIIGDYLGKPLPEELSPAPIEMRIPLVSMVSAGALADTGNGEGSQTITPLTLGPGKWVAFRVEGDSMDRISPPGSLILVNSSDKRVVGQSEIINDSIALGPQFR